MLGVVKDEGYWFFNQTEKEWNYLQNQQIAKLVVVAFMNGFFIT